LKNLKSLIKIEKIERNNKKMDLITIIGILGAAGIGIALGIFFKERLHQQEIKQGKSAAQQIMDMAKKDAEEIKITARKEAKQLAREEKEDLDRYVSKKQKEIKDQEKELTKVEAIVEQKQKELTKEKEKLSQQEQVLKTEQQKITEQQQETFKAHEALKKKLEEIAQLSKEEAKQQLLSEMQEAAKVDFVKILKKLEEDTNEEAEKKAKRIIGIAIQRFAGEYVGEKTISSVDLPSDELKGRLIGREGRNIRAFEQICGVDLIIDDTPGIVVLSSFNVVRREIAKLTIQKLIADGRIHPAKIEEFFEKSKKEIDKTVKDLGEKAQMEIGVHGIHVEILKLVGALNWRTSYTQNQYQHALEAAFICGAMAAEMGLNVKQARRAALLHDIGKVLDASAEGSHAVIGADFAKKYGESAEIVHAIRAHHDDEKPQSVLAHLVTAADALSGARPGARKAMMESYISRLTDIEEIVNTFDGVSRSFALSGGKEVRVFVQNDKVNDEQTVMLSRDIAKKIESEMSYPGTIKVTVVRETKAVGIAR